MKSQKYIFLLAFLAAIIIFAIGIYAGYKLEGARLGKIDNLYLNSELDLLDQRIISDSFDLIDLNCDKITEANINFGDKIFQDVQQIEKIENANRINSDIKLERKKFALLRTFFWINSMKIKEKCNSSYTDVVYFYTNNESPTTTAEQKVFENYLTELKQTYGNSIILIPIEADRTIPSIDLLLNQYQIENVPVILIDEKTKIDNVADLPKTESYLK